MIIWRGWGIIVFFVVFASSLVAQVLTNTLTGSGAYWKEHGWPFACALACSGAVIWLIDQRLSRGRDRTLVDVQTGERVVIRRAHDFFFLRLRWWGVICVVLSVMLLFSGWSPQRTLASENQRTQMKLGIRPR